MPQSMHNQLSGVLPLRSNSSALRFLLMPPSYAGADERSCFSAPISCDYEPRQRRRAADARDADGPPSTTQRGGESLSLREDRLPSAASDGLAIAGQLSAVACRARNQKSGP